MEKTTKNNRKTCPIRHATAKGGPNNLNILARIAYTSTHHHSLLLASFLSEFLSLD
jgi:hypothetical protein